jgi:hypothetical protein
MIPTITKGDLSLINSLSSRKYIGNRLLSNATENERNQLKEIKEKLKSTAEYFANKYSYAYGPFETSVASGNPIAIGGKNFNRVWSSIFKGGDNKQYAAQISMVMNPQELCLDVGFYFGRASGHSVTYDQRIILEEQLNNLGITLSQAILSDTILNEKYNALFDLGFRPFANGNFVLSDTWLNEIRTHTKSSQIVVKIFPNDFDIIENATLDYYISQAMFLMSAFTNRTISKTKHYLKPPTPEQRAKQAERLALIGQKGELFALDYEKGRLKSLGIKFQPYPKHVALESMTFGYDILSIDENKNELYIEVKTTTRTQEDPYSRQFSISLNEYNKFTKYKSQFKLYRVYDIDGSAHLEELDLTLAKKMPDGYIISY